MAARGDGDGSGRGGGGRERAALRGRRCGSVDDAAGVPAHPDGQTPVRGPKLGCGEGTSGQMTTRLIYIYAFVSGVEQPF